MNNIKRRSRQLLSLLAGITRYPFYRSKYQIKRGYIHRNKYDHFNDIGATDEGQDEVYQIAEKIARENNCKTILDIGCGSAYKLFKYFEYKYQFSGVEILGTYEYLRKKHPNNIWLNGRDVDYGQLNADLIICSDVIEHVVDPDELIK